LFKALKLLGFYSALCYNKKARKLRVPGALWLIGMTLFTRSLL